MEPRLGNGCLNSTLQLKVLFSKLPSLCTQLAIQPFHWAPLWPVRALSRFYTTGGQRLPFVTRVGVAERWAPRNSNVFADLPNVS